MAHVSDYWTPPEITLTPPKMTGYLLRKTKPDHKRFHDFNFSPNYEGDLTITFGTLQNAVQQTVKHIREDNCTKSKDRNARSKAYLSEDNDPYGTKLYSYIKGDRVAKTSTLTNKKGELTSNVPEIIEEIESAWTQKCNKI